MRALMRLSAAMLVAALSTACSSTASDTAPESEPQALEAGDPMEQMDAWMAMNQPGEEHALLGPLVGTFQTHVTMWMGPGAPAQESTGTMKNEWILGGRFVRSTYHGEFMGQPFEGLGLTGYDTTTGTYQGLWIDSATTMIPPPSKGTVSEDGKTFTFLHEMQDPMSGATMQMKEILTVQDPAHHTIDAYTTMNGETYHSMHIEYSR